MRRLDMYVIIGFMAVVLPRAIAMFVFIYVFRQSQWMCNGIDPVARTPVSCRVGLIRCFDGTTVMDDERYGLANGEGILSAFCRMSLLIQRNPFQNRPRLNEQLYCSPILFGSKTGIPCRKA